METLLNLLPNQPKRGSMIIACFIFLFVQAMNTSASPEERLAVPKENSLDGWNICWDGKEIVAGKDDGREPMLTLACMPNINVSLGQQGYALLTSTLLVIDPQYPVSQYDINIMGPLKDTVYCAQLGQDLMVVVNEIPSGNSCMSIIHIEDKLKPVLVCTSDVLPCNVDIPSIDFESFIESVTDNCDPDPNLWYAYTIQNLPCNPEGYTQKISVIWTATDHSGNSSTCEDVIYLQKPTIYQVDFPANITISCVNANIDPSVTGEPTYHGVPVGTCPCQIIVSHTDQVVPMCNGSQKILRSWTIMDWCNSGMNNHTQEIRIIDNIPPVITCPANVTVGTNLNLCTYKYTLPLPVVTDQCANTNLIDIDIFVSGIPGIFAPGNKVTLGLGTTFITIRATDPCANSSMCQYSVTVKDNTPPTIVCPGNVTVDCNESTGPEHTGYATATDACDAAPDVAYSDVTVSTPNCAVGYITSRTWRATDDSGNTSSCMQMIVLTDHAPPLMTCPDNITLQCANQVPVPNPAGVLASDNCSGMASVTFAGDAISNQTCTNRYTLTRTYRAMDNCGNSATCNQIITVFDNTPPALTCPADVTVQCASQIPAPNTGSVTSTENCAGAATITHVGDVISGQICLNKYIVTRTYRATDACGNSAVCSQAITVYDNTAPSISCPINVTVQCASQVPAANPASVGATDNCGGTATVTLIGDEINNLTCTNRYTETRTYKATDACGNSATCSQTITVFDNTLPSLTCPPNVTVDCASQVPTPDPGSITSSDNCNGAATITHVGDVISNQTCTNRFTVTRTYRAIDACGNSATCSHVITVFDNTPPPITCPANVTLQCASQVPAPTNPALLATTDNCGGTATVTFLGDVTTNQICVNKFTLTRTYRTTDACGNSATCAQIIVVNDNLAPALTCPPSVTIQCTESTAPAHTGNASASDNCDAIPVISHSDVTVGGVCPQEYTITRTWGAMDVCGNSGTCNQTIVVDDSTPPSCLTHDITVFLNGNGEVTIQASQVDNGSTDNCGPVSLSVSPSMFTCDNLGINLVVLTVTDCPGNSSTCTANVTVVDNGSFQANCQNITRFLDASGHVTITPEEIDNGSGGGCNGGIIHLDLNQTDFDCSNVGLNTVTLTVTDDIGHIATCTATVTILDDIPPVITCPLNVTVDCHSVTNPNNTSQFGNATATDNCPGTIITETHVLNLNSCNLGTISRSFTATDDSGNTATCSQTVTINNPDPLDLGDITWPASPVHVNICNSTEPQNIPNGVPVIAQSALQCANPVVTHVDLVQTNVDNNPNTPCRTITRTWTIVDNCQVPIATFTFVQTIYVEDMVGPLFTNINDMSGIANENCVKHFTIIASATDCGGGVSITNNSPFGSGSDASGDYPIGVTVVIFTATDMCGNISTMDVVITVIDPNPTTFHCVKRIVNIPAEEPHEITISGRFFVIFTDGNCSDPQDFIVSYTRTNPFDTTRVFDCGDIGVSTFPLWFWTANGNQLVDSCLFADLELRDPNHYCDGGLVLFGDVMNEDGHAVSGIEVSVANALMPPDTTDEKGRYYLGGLNKGKGYMVVPLNDQKPREGVSTLDLVMIQKHLLGKAKLNSPYKMIAADANRSGNVTALDLIEIRKLILGIYDRFTNNTSWRFIDQSYSFPDPYNPFAYPFKEQVWLDSITQDINAVNFVGVKIGDINGSYFQSRVLGERIETRSLTDFELEMNVNSSPQSPVDKIEIVAPSGQGDIDGMQFSVFVGELTPEQVRSIHSDLLNPDEWYYDYYGGTLNVSWSTAKAEDISGKMILTISGINTTSRRIELESYFIQPEAYKVEDVNNMIRNIHLKVHNGQETTMNEYHLYQNIPNPFIDGTIISFYLPQQETIRMVIYDSGGKQVFNYTGLMGAGHNEIPVKGSSLKQAGIYYYTLYTANASFTRKMSFTNN